ARDDGDLRAPPLLGARRGEPAPALCRDAPALVPALPGARGGGRKDVRPRLRARLAALPGRVDRGVRHGFAAAVPGRVRAPARQRAAPLPRPPLPVAASCPSSASLPAQRTRRKGRLERAVLRGYLRVRSTVTRETTSGKSGPGGRRRRGGRAGTRACAPSRPNRRTSSSRSSRDRCR